MGKVSNNDDRNITMLKYDNIVVESMMCLCCHAWEQSEVPEKWERPPLCHGKTKEQVEMAITVTEE